MTLYAVIQSNLLGNDEFFLFKKKSNALKKMEKLKKKYSKDKSVKVIEDDDFHKRFYNDNGFDILRKDRELYDRIYIEKIKTKD